MSPENAKKMLSDLSTIEMFADIKEASKAQAKKLLYGKEKESNYEKACLLLVNTIEARLQMYLHLPSEMRAQLKEMAIAATNNVDLPLAELNNMQSSLAPLNHQIDFQPSEAVEIFQGDYAVTASTADKFVLATFYASPCLIVALYDSSNQIAVLAHVDAATKINSLDSLLSPISKKDSKAYIYSSQNELATMCLEIINFFKKNDVQIAIVDTAEKNKESVSLAINAKTGHLYLDVTPLNATRLSERPSLTEMILKRSQGAPIHLLYNGCPVSCGQPRNKEILLPFIRNILNDYKTNQLGLALRKAADQGDLNTLALLIEYGVDVNERGPTSGQTAYDRALAKGHDQCVLLLKKAIEIGKRAKIEICSSNTHPSLVSCNNK